MSLREIRIMYLYRTTGKVAALFSAFVMQHVMTVKCPEKCQDLFLCSPVIGIHLVDYFTVLERQVRK